MNMKTSAKIQFECMSVSIRVLRGQTMNVSFSHWTRYNAVGLSTVWWV